MSFRTLSIRPTTIYGEEDNFFLAEPLRIAKKLGRWNPVNCKDTVHHLTYVGNTAWAFICADKALIKDATHATEDSSSKDGSLTTKTAHTVGGKAFFITDDSPLMNMFEFQSVFMSACGFRTNVFRIPAFIVLLAWYIMYWFMWFISFIVKVNLYAGIPSVKFFRKTFTFKLDFARKSLNYIPIYSFEKSKKRSMDYYKRKYSTYK